MKKIKDITYLNALLNKEVSTKHNQLKKNMT